MKECEWPRNECFLAGTRSQIVCQVHVGNTTLAPYLLDSMQDVLL